MMKKRLRSICLGLVLLICFISIALTTTICTSCKTVEDSEYGEEEPVDEGSDSASKLDVSVSGSLQNPTWSPDGDAILFTRFRNGYNREPADLFIFTIDSNTAGTLVSDGSGNINLPGSSWNAFTRKIVFSSTREPHDEIFLIDENGTTGDETKITDRRSLVSYEPSFSPNGLWVVFETHRLDVEGEGIITKYKVDGSGPYIDLTIAGEDCRQPNWSPAGDKILYQKLSGGRWDIWIMNTDGSNHQMITSGPGDKTDASFSPDGQQVVYSSDEKGLEFANLFIIPITGGLSTRLTFYDGYNGAPSWSPDGTRVVFESCIGDPDESEGTFLWVINAPQ